jgi:hypothetical protein
MKGKFAQSFIAGLLAAGVLTLAACQGTDTTSSAGAGGTFGPGQGGGGGGGGGGPPVPPPPVAGVPTLVITLADPITGAATTSIPAVARAIVRDASGNPVPSVVVTFTTNASLAATVPPSGTALTDAAGTATVVVNPAALGSSGAATLTATTQVPATTGSVGFSIGASNVTLSVPVFGSNPLSAFGTTSVSVTVSSGGAPVTTPQTVNFSSICAGSGKAVLTASVLTGAGGVATASYRDNGCGTSDTVTASVTGFAPSSASLTISVPAAGSIQFVSATPSNITLKGTGGAGLQETSQVIFKVVDVGGNPIGGQTVNFSLSTIVGGLAFANGLATSTAISDATTGQAVVFVNSGTISTPVRVLATTLSSSGVTLSTQSDQLTVTTGIPDQDSFSLSATVFNLEGWEYDGVVTTFTARLSDHFSNPVPNGTTVNFIAEGGQMQSSCSISQGACQATLTSAALRPLNGRVTVLAYAVGEESFTDIDGDGLASLVNHSTGTSELVDANGQSTDMPEAFADYNENGIRDLVAGSAGLLEPFVDFNNNGVFDGPDGKYNGTLCNDVTGTSSPGTCAVSRSINVRRNFPILFSGSHPVVMITDSLLNPVGSVALGSCNPNATASLLVTITDVNGNIMPAGTTISFASTNGQITSLPVSFVVPNSQACLAGSGAGYSSGPIPAGFGCPVSSEVPLGSAPLTYAVSFQSNATVNAGPPPTCTNPISTGVFTITVTTPKAVTTIVSIPVTD